jgi:hypothetical protein
MTAVSTKTFKFTQLSQAPDAAPSFQPVGPPRASLDKNIEIDQPNDCRLDQPLAQDGYSASLAGWSLGIGPPRRAPSGPVLAADDNPRRARADAGTRLACGDEDAGEYHRAAGELQRRRPLTEEYRAERERPHHHRRAANARRPGRCGPPASPSTTAAAHQPVINGNDASPETALRMPCAPIGPLSTFS